MYKAKTTEKGMFAAKFDQVFVFSSSPCDFISVV